MNIRLLQSYDLSFYRRTRLLHVPGSFRVVIDTVIRSHGAPADNAGCGRCGKCDYIRTGERSGGRRIDKVLASDTEHDDECDHIGDPSDAFVSEKSVSWSTSTIVSTRISLVDNSVTAKRDLGMMTSLSRVAKKEKQHVHSQPAI